MAVSPGPGTLEKRCLNSAPMYINRIRGGSEATYTYIRFMIHKFSELKENVTYTNLLPNLMWGFYIIKKKKTLIVTLFTSVCKLAVECFIGYEQKGHCSECFAVKELVGGVYEAEIPLKFIKVPENAYLRGDVVNIQMKLDKCRKRNFTTRPFVCRGNDLCIEKLSRDITNRSPNDICIGNYVIHFEDFVMLIHKEILAARSKLFYTICTRNLDHGKLIELDKDWTQLERTRSTVNTIMSYMYTGKVKLLNLKEMISVLILASKFQIPSLQSLCTVALIDKINQYNVYEIKEAGIKSGEKSLLTAVNIFFEEFNIPGLVPTGEDESLV